MRVSIAEKRDLVPLVNLISIYFQIRDDYMNLQSTEVKITMDSLKTSIPIIKGTAKTSPKGNSVSPSSTVYGQIRPIAKSSVCHPDILITDVLQKRTHSISLKTHTVEYLRNQTRSFEYTRGVLRTLYGQIEEEVKRFGGNSGLAAILKRLSVPVETAQENGGPHGS